MRPTTARDGGAKPQRDRADYRHASGPSGAPDKKGDVGPGATEFEFVSGSIVDTKVSGWQIVINSSLISSTEDTDVEPSPRPNRFIPQIRLLDGDK